MTGASLSSRSPPRPCGALLPRPDMHSGHHTRYGRCVNICYQDSSRHCVPGSRSGRLECIWLLVLLVLVVTWARFHMLVLPSPFLPNSLPSTRRRDRLPITRRIDRAYCLFARRHTLRRDRLPITRSTSLRRTHNLLMFRTSGDFRRWFQSSCKVNPVSPNTSTSMARFLSLLVVFFGMV